MILLKIEKGKGYYRCKDEGDYKPLDLLTRDDMLEMFKYIFKIKQSEFSFKEYVETYDEERISNEAHKIIYEKVCNKLRELWDTKDAIINEINSDFKEIEKKYL